ncbi:MAG TPA: DUF447 domain-containing protein [Pirellulales bacterium]|nr:DUF447 domain-containing protein [Pirellulales bacterium]
MILESLVTTLNDDSSLHVAPMGPRVEPDMRRIVLRPFQTATTFHNLKHRGQGVMHVTDDVELLARAAVGRVDPPPETLPAASVEGRILSGACRWYAFRVVSLDDSHERATIVADVVDWGAIRDFFGFNRAKHAVVEAAILATRTRILPADEIRADFRRLAKLVEKTGGPQEHRAFEFLRSYVDAQIGEVTT